MTVEIRSVDKEAGPLHYVLSNHTQPVQDVKKFTACGEEKVTHKPKNNAKEYSQYKHYNKTLDILKCTGE